MNHYPSNHYQKVVKVADGIIIHRHGMNHYPSNHYQMVVKVAGVIIMIYHQYQIYQQLILNQFIVMG